LARRILAPDRNLDSRPWEDGIQVAGADLVEVAPAYDHAEMTAIAAANIAYETLCLFAFNRSQA
jgi:Arginase family